MSRRWVQGWQIVCFLVSQHRFVFPGNLRRYILKKFVYPSDMSFVVKEADVVVTRGGANTITLLLELIKPSIVIPLAVSQHDEQLKNALFLKAAGIGEVILQKDLTGKVLENLLLT